MRFAINVTTPPAVEPLTLPEAKEYLRVSHDDEDDLISDTIAAARELIETVTRRQLMTATLELTLDAFPRPDRCDPTTYGGGLMNSYADAYGGGPTVWGQGQAIVIPRPPLQSVTSITYVDQGGATQTLASNAYQVDAKNEPGRILPAFNAYWPLTRNQINAVTVTYVAGWTSQTLPKKVKSLARLLLAHLYEHRDDDAGPPPAIKSLMWKLRFGDIA